jgi:glycosyltransferase involved in cell wall biosynthesis
MAGAAADLVVMDRYRIAHVTATFPPYLGGTGNVCYHNARVLAERGHQVSVFTAAVPGAPERETRAGVQVQRIQPFLRVGNAMLLPGLYKILSGFDLIHWHYPFFGGEITALVAHRRGIPLVVTYHQDVLLTGLGRWIELFMRFTVDRWALRKARRVLFTSQDYGEASYARALLKGREDRIGALPNGVDVAVFTPGDPPTALLEEYRIRPGDLVALLVAGLDRAHYFKGVPVFLEVLARLSGSVKGVIVGEGDLRESYQRKAQDLGLAERVHFPGRVADGDLPEHYRLADVTVLPSVTMGEAFGLVLVESLACGRPVIASDLPGVRTVVDQDVDGYLVQPGSVDELAERLGHILALPQAERQAMGAAGRRKVERKYAWERIGDQLETIYQACLEAPA